MKSTIRIVKRKREADPEELPGTESEKAVVFSTREIANTIKGWIADVERRKREQVRSFASLSIAVTEPEPECLERPA